MIFNPFITKIKSSGEVSFSEVSEFKASNAFRCEFSIGALSSLYIQNPNQVDSELLLGNSLGIEAWGSSFPSFTKRSCVKSFRISFSISSKCIESEPFKFYNLHFALVLPHCRPEPVLM